MARAILDTGANGITLQLDYGSLVDAATNGAVTNSTTSVKFSSLGIYIVTGQSFYDSSNKLVVSGTGVTTATFNNLSINVGGSSSQLAASLTPAARAIVFGGVNTIAVGATFTGLGYPGDMSGSYVGSTPRRPYRAPITPTLTIGNGTLDIAGNQNTASADQYWAQMDIELEKNSSGTFTSLASNTAGSTTFINWSGVADARYRCRARAKNADLTGSFGYSGYWYTTPARPTGLTAARAASGSTSVNLSWTNNATYSGSVDIQRSDNGLPLQVVATLSGNATSYTDTLPVSSSAVYTVVCRTPVGTNQGNSGSSVSASVPQGVVAPAKPGLQLTKTGTTTAEYTISGNVTDPNDAARWESIELQMQAYPAAWDTPRVLVASTTTGNLTELAANNRFEIRARSVNSAGASAWRYAGFIYTNPSAPVGFTATRNTNAPTQVQFGGTSAAPWAPDIQIEMFLEDSVEWVALGTLAAGGSFSVSQAYEHARDYRAYTITPAPTAQSYYVYAHVPVQVETDKSKLPGVDRLYVGSAQVRQMYVASTRVWSDGS